MFNTRNLDATVELRDGQSFSVAGLLQNDTKLSQNQLPWLGDVPDPRLAVQILELPEARDRARRHRHAAPRPAERRPARSSPRRSTRPQPANDAEFFALGQMEVTPKMLKTFQSGAGVAGPYGYIIDLGGTAQ